MKTKIAHISFPETLPPAKVAILETHMKNTFSQVNFIYAKNSKVVWPEVGSLEQITGSAESPYDTEYAYINGIQAALDEKFRELGGAE